MDHCTHHLEQVKYFPKLLMGFQPNPYSLQSPREADQGAMSGVMVKLSESEGGN